MSGHGVHSMAGLHAPAAYGAYLEELLAGLQLPHAHGLVRGRGEEAGRVDCKGPAWGT